ncbi:hypothetical protein C8R47DRAFT_1204614 [Mycena vitilis]|nr:hypothetical protein C8R47DRAFT_1204614 [Mycena vitilis]
MSKFCARTRSHSPVQAVQLQQDDLQETEFAAFILGPWFQQMFSVARLTFLALAFRSNSRAKNETEDVLIRMRGIEPRSPAKPLFIMLCVAECQILRGLRNPAIFRGRPSARAPSLRAKVVTVCCSRTHDKGNGQRVYKQCKARTVASRHAGARRKGLGCLQNELHDFGPEAKALRRWQALSSPGVMLANLREGLTTCRLKLPRKMLGIHAFSRSPAAHRQTRQGEKVWRNLFSVGLVTSLEFCLRTCSVEVPKELECGRRACKHRLVLVLTAWSSPSCKSCDGVLGNFALRVELQARGDVPRERRGGRRCSLPMNECQGWVDGGEDGGKEEKDWRSSSNMHVII